MGSRDGGISKNRTKMAAASAAEPENGNKMKAGTATTIKNGLRL
jgi:hypothetical protein